MGKMHSYFEFGYKMENLLFKGISVSTVEEMIAVCAIAAVIVACYESIKVFKGYASEKSLSMLKMTSRTAKTTKCIMNGIFSSDKYKRVKHRVLQTVLYTLQTFLGYLVMLLVMSFNIWLLITVLVTSGFSYFLYGLITTRKLAAVPTESSSSRLTDGNLLRS